MRDEYPTDEELRTIREWDVLKNPVSDLLGYVRDIWWTSEMGYKLSGKKVLKLELHTLGWSGNEQIISALQGNFMFWGMFWERSCRGGHYYFRISLIKIMLKQ